MAHFYAALSTQSKTDSVAKALDQCKDTALCEAIVSTSSFPIQYQVFYIPQLYHQPPTLLADDTGDNQIVAFVYHTFVCPTSLGK